MISKRDAKRSAVLGNIIVFRNISPIDFLPEKPMHED